MRAMTVDIIRPDALSAVDIAAWEHMRAHNPALYSPYFHVNYTQYLGALRDDARVIIAREKDRAVAFLPIQGSGKFTAPLGAPMSDYQGFISAAHTDLDFEDILRRAGIGAFHFTAMVDNDLARRHSLADDPVAMIHMPAGGQSWRDAQDGSYRRSLKSLRRRIRNTESDHGKRRFVYQSNDRDVFNTLMRWKRRKFEETGKYDVLCAKWTLPLLETLWTAGLTDKDAALRCDMHALYFGDRLAAIDLGLSDGPTFHSWIVAYDSELSNLSPGIQLLEGVIDAADNLGYSRIDLGAGIEGYKRYYATENLNVHSGFIAVKGPAAALSNIYGAAEKFGEKAMADIPGKLRRRYTQIAACEDTLSGRARAMIDAVKTTGRAG
ncbi:GNAT family N-acetyltransferase [Fretibacter rubidus]|uniref:GNAT family N-acetyltransferase n=1 Tax=Fretibacter rubidus TaxID=570162 RepID=UPI00352B0162